jgi:hypothetical protein
LEIWLGQLGGKASQSKSEPTMADDWKCPICKEYAGPRCLRIDEWFVSLRSYLIKNDLEKTKSIKVEANGKMTTSEEDCAPPTLEPDSMDVDVIEISDG